LLQEIDLPAGSTMIGRGAHCQITIDDPLVSREHATIRVEGDRISVEDMGSRNGLIVRGKPVKGVVELSDGDRIRVGAQELVVCAAQPTQQGTQRRTTGFMCHCAGCGMPYPAEMMACPSCGSRERGPDDTLTGSESERDWQLELAADALRRAVQRDRWEDVERLLLRARLHIEQRIADGRVVDRAALAILGDAAAGLSAARSDATWARWALSLYASLAEVPSAAMARRVAQLGAEQRASLAPAARRVIESVSSKGGPRDDERSDYDLVAALAEAGGSG
jgi:hypothetical protein